MHLVIIGPKQFNLQDLTRQVSKTLKRRHLNIGREIEFQLKRPLSKLQSMVIRKREKYIIRRLSHNDNLVIQSLERTFLYKDNLNKIRKNACFILLTVTEANYRKQLQDLENAEAMIEAFVKRQERLKELFPNQFTIDNALPLTDKARLKQAAKEIIELASTLQPEFKKPDEKTT